MAKKEKEKEIPKIEKSEETLTNKQLNDLAEELQIINPTNEAEESNENYYKIIAKSLMSPENISLKTEYLTVNENFSSVRLTFLGKYSNMPYALEFINILELKRVSLNRKSRKELIMSLEKRSEDLGYNQPPQQKTVFGY